MNQTKNELSNYAKEFEQMMADFMAIAVLSKSANMDLGSHLKVMAALFHETSIAIAAANEVPEAFTHFTKAIQEINNQRPAYYFQVGVDNKVMQRGVIHF